MDPDTPTVAVPGDDALAEPAEAASPVDPLPPPSPEPLSEPQLTEDRAAAEEVAVEFTPLDRNYFDAIKMAPVPNPASAEQRVYASAVDGIWLHPWCGDTRVVEPSD